MMSDGLRTAVLNTLFALVHPGQRFFWLFLLASSAIAIFLSYLSLPGARVRSARATLKLAFPVGVYLHRSALLDYRYAVINSALSVLIVCATGFGTVLVTQWTLAGLGAIWTPSSQPPEASLAVGLLYAFMALAAFDTANFFAHYLQHRIPALWEFHKVHHSAEVLTPITVLRMHPVDDIVTATTHALGFGLANGVFLHLYGGPATQVSVLGTNVFFFIYFVCAYHLRHSHIWVMFPKGVREIFSSPALHLIHHSKAEHHWDKNFAPVFTFWDWLFGTLYQPLDREQIEIGIAEGDAQALHSVGQLYITPVRKAFALLGFPATSASNPATGQIVSPPVARP
jgi:sterol desaturase/sphingolipid hydroxylase (fatty acid hydroxylase superfamily)